MFQSNTISSKLIDVRSKVGISQTFVPTKKIEMEGRGKKMKDS